MKKVILSVLFFLPIGAFADCKDTLLSAYMSYRGELLSEHSSTENILDYFSKKTRGSISKGKESAYVAAVKKQHEKILSIKKYGASCRDDGATLYLELEATDSYTRKDVWFKYEGPKVVIYGSGRESVPVPKTIRMYAVNKSL